MEKKNDLLSYFWQVTYAHSIAYFIAGVIAMAFMNYEALWATEIMSGFYRPIDSPIVGLGGTILQIPRGILIALFILPLRKVFFEEKLGLLKLGLIVFGFSVISTIGAVCSSYEGYIYLKLPLEIHLMGYFECVLYISLFIGILFIAQKFAHKKIVTILPIILIILLILMGLTGFLAATGNL
ncbi:MAG: hypothetical protein FWD47_12460 [Treponema sp.]|nr:hypothetical protein [Treponema sp.]